MEKRESKQQSIIAMMCITLLTAIVVVCLTTIAHHLISAKEEGMRLEVVGGIEKAHAIRDVAIIALQQKMDGSGALTLNGVVDCGYDGWKQLPHGVNKTLDISQSIGMLPNQGRCQFKLGGSLQGNASIPVALVDPGALENIRQKIEEMQ